MKKLLLAVLFASSAATAIADDAQQKTRAQREIFERECAVGVTLGIYALARLEMIEVNLLLEKKQQIAPLCKSLGDAEIAPLFETDETELRIRYGGGLLAAQGMGIAEERLEGKFSKAMIHLIGHRGKCDCEDLEEDLGNYERLVKNHLPMPSVADLEAKAREHSARIREYAFVDACARGKEIGHQAIDADPRPTDEDRKRFTQQCAGIYVQPDLRKTLDPMDLASLHDESCKMGAELVYREKGVQPTMQQFMSQHFHCKSISYSARTKAENTAARRETRRSRIQPAEDAMWQELRDEG